MEINSLAAYSQMKTPLRTAAELGVSVVGRSLDQQQLDGQAALTLMEAAAVLIELNPGQNIDIYV